MQKHGGFFAHKNLHNLYKAETIAVYAVINPEERGAVWPTIPFVPEQNGYPEEIKGERP